MSVLVKGETGIEKFILISQLASKFKNIIWITSNLCPDKIKLFFDNLDCEVNLKTIICRRCSEPEPDQYANPLNLNEISISMSKLMPFSDGNRFIVVIDNLSEILVIHKVEKVYLFLLDFLSKVSEKGGGVLGCMVSGAQDQKSEILISSIFDWVISIHKSVEKLEIRKILIIEKWLAEPPREILEFTINEGKIKIDEDIWNFLDYALDFK